MFLDNGELQLEYNAMTMNRYKVKSDGLIATGKGLIGGVLNQKFIQGHWKRAMLIGYAVGGAFAATYRLDLQHAGLDTSSITKSEASTERLFVRSRAR